MSATRKQDAAGEARVGASPKEQETDARKDQRDGNALTLERLWMKVRVIFSMCVYSVSSRRFLWSFSLFFATSLSSISSLWSCSWTWQGTRQKSIKNKWINLLTVFYFIQATTPVCRKHACSSDERLVLVTPWKSDPYLTVCHFRQSYMGQLWFAPTCNNQQQARSAAEAGGFD